MTAIIFWALCVFQMTAILGIQAYSVHPDLRVFSEGKVHIIINKENLTPVALSLGSNIVIVTKSPLTPSKGQLAISWRNYFIFPQQALKLSS